jgi:hypothetical protein
MINLASDNPTHLTQLILWPNFPLPPQTRTKARKKFFSQKIQSNSKEKLDFEKKFERSSFEFERSIGFKN